MRNKKLLSILLALALVLTSLTACNGAGAGNTEDPNSSISSEVESGSETEKTTENEEATEKPSEDTGSNSGDNTGNTDNTGDNTGNTGDNSGNTGDNSGNSGNTGDNTGNSGSTGDNSGNSGSTVTGGDMNTPGITLSQIPAYSNSYSYKLNNGVPFFATSSSTKAYEFYSELDSLGRCGVAHALLGPELLPTEDRGSISSVKPSGWIQASYSCVPGGSLWNRSHLIAFSLAGENANKQNLITGTQHMNQIEMQVYEQQVLDYIKETGNHVMYRVTPLYDGNNLVATGVLMEGWSVEDEGESICFNVFLYNVQDGVTINYATGASSEAGSTGGSTDTENSGTTSGGSSGEPKFMVNKGNGKIHDISCSSVTQTKEENRHFCATWEEVMEFWNAGGYSEDKRECGNCHAYSENAN